MSSLFNPAKSLMGRLRFAHKFALIAAIFLIALTFTLTLIIRDHWHNYQFFQSEIKGLQHTKGIGELIGQISLNGTYQYVYFNGYEGAERQIRLSATEVEERLQPLTSLANDIGDIETRKLIQKIQEDWQTIQFDKVKNLTAGDGQHWLSRDFAALGKPTVLLGANTFLVKELTFFNDEINHRFNLAYDSDQETTFYLTLANRDLIQLITSYQAMCASVGGIIAKNKFTPDSYTTAKRWSNQTLALVSDLEKKIQFGQKLMGEDLFASDTEFSATIEDTMEQIYSYEENVLESSHIDVNEETFLKEVTDHSAKLVLLRNKLLKRAEADLLTRMDKQKQLQLWLVVVMAFALLLSIYVFVGLYDNITSTIQTLSEAATRLSMGDLTVRSTPNSQDEMAQIVLAFNAIARAFDGLVSKTKQSMEAVENSVETISTVTDETLKGSEEQNHQVDVMVVSMEQMSASAEDVERNTVDAAEAAKIADEEAKKGNHIVATAIDLITSLTEEVVHTREAMLKLSEDVKSVGLVTDVITSIAEQTNLLALNAAIEAARAGEQGRGFAVVADEVRALAQKTRESTEQIQATVNELQSASVRVANITEKSSERVQESRDQVQLAGEALARITELATTISQMTAQIASAATQQATTASEMTNNIESIKDISSKTTIGNQKLAKDRVHLHELADQFIQSLTIYKVTHESTSQKDRQRPL